MSIYLQLSRGISELKVLIGQEITRCIVIPDLVAGIAYISPSLAEAIKQTHIPANRAEVWEPHVPRHNHADTPRPGAHHNWNKHARDAKCQAHTTEEGS
jgi:hypothetical protein